MFKVGDIVVSKRVDRTIIPRHDDMHKDKEKLLGNIYEIYHIQEKNNHQCISTRHVYTNMTDMIWVWFETEVELYKETPKDRVKRQLLKEVT